MHIVTISGKAQHGKDTLGNKLFDALKKNGDRVLLTHNADLLKYMCKAYFGWDGEKDSNGRKLLQYVGTDVVRKKEPDFWVDFLIRVMKLFDDYWDYVIIPDTRFPNEIDRFIDNGFKVTHVRVIRPDFDNGLSAEQQNHISETALDNTTPDWIVVNDGSMERLNTSVSSLVCHLEDRSKR